VRVLPVLPEGPAARHFLRYTASRGACVGRKRNLCQPAGESCEPKTHDEVVAARAGFCYLLGAGVEDGAAGAGVEAAGVLLSVGGLEGLLSELPPSLEELVAGLAEA